MTERIDEKKLVEHLRKGDVIAFDTLFDEYSQKLFGFALKYLKNESEAEELVQEVFIKVWENRKSLKSGLSFKAYLFTISLNQIRKYFKKRAISLRYFQSLKDEKELAENTTEQYVDYESTLAQLNKIIGQLPPRRREIFIKCKMEGKNSKEIAAELNISSATVDNQVSESLRFIRSNLNDTSIALLLMGVLFLF